MPAHVPEATRFRDVAVLQFDGVDRSNREGKEFSAELESTLTAIRVDDKAYFAVVDRQKLDQVTKELALGQSGLIDANTVARIGQMTGAKALYTGAVTQSRANDERFSQESEECVDKKCSYTRKRVTYCTRRTAIFTVTPKLVDVQSGRIIYSRTINGSGVGEMCQGQGQALPTQAELARAARADVAQQIAADVAPHQVSMKLEFLDMTDGIDQGSDKDLLDRGITFAKKQRMERACEEWNTALSKEPNSPALNFNAGVCSELHGQLEDAAAHYGKADKLYTGTGTGSVMSALSLGNAADPTKIIGDALKRVKDGLKKQAELKKQAN
jgi:curli biogenesis system outer membrane secretion channel CsgG